ncbi:MAG: hypothetical protein LBS23_03165 [Holosporaceae bacterium]|nr:hypothetical protein [Holosporaceae bacterium]
MTININISNFQEWIFTFILGIEAKIAAIIAAKKLSEELEFYATQVSAFFLVLANLTWPSF